MGEPVAPRCDPGTVAVARRGRVVVCATVVGVALVLLLRMTLRDSCRGFDVVYYAMPLPVLALLLAVCAWRRRRDRRRIHRWLTLAACALLAVHLGSSWRRRGSVPAQGEHPVRIVMWNVGRGLFPAAALPERLAAFEADVLCLVESAHVAAMRAVLNERLPLHTVATFAGGFTILVRGQVGGEVLPLAHGRAVRATVSLADGRPRFDLVLVDVPSNPLRSRLPFFAELQRELASTPQRPELVLGDFNTPRASAGFDAMRADMAHAFETAGDGLAETWPLPLPVLDLDHIWLRRDLRAIACGHRASWQSDHLAVVLDFESPRGVGPHREPDAAVRPR